MGFLFDNFPYTNFHELNLDYFINKFNKIFTEWEQLNTTMLEWKAATDASNALWKTSVENGLAAWKTATEADLNARETALRAELSAWKTATEADIGTWETVTLAALNAWKATAEATFEAIRVQAAASATAAQMAQTAAETAQTAAETAQTAAETAAASVSASAAQITTNTEDIADLRTHFNHLDIEMTPRQTFTGKRSKVDGLTDDANYTTYQYEIPSNVTAVHVITRLMGTSFIILSDQGADAVFENYEMEKYPTSGYESLTNVDTTLQTDGFKYLYVPCHNTATKYSVTYSALQVIGDKVDKNGVSQVTADNAQFLQKISSANLLNVADGTYTESPLTLEADDNHFAVTKSADLTGRVMIEFASITLPAGTYTVSIYPDANYADLYGGACFIGLYTGPNHNILSQYIWITYVAGTSKTFTLEAETTFYVILRTQEVTETNATLNGGDFGFKIMFAKSNSALPWADPNPTYKLIYGSVGVDEIEKANGANIGMFEKIGVIGDSYASGQIYLSGNPVNYYNLSWGQVLARRIGSTVINFSSGGLTTKTWLTAEKGLPLLQSSDPQGLYIVALGLNDYTDIVNEDYSLGTQADFDLSDYENTPDTFYGNMCKIIGYILAKSSGAKIILSTMASNDGTLRQQINGAIEKCAELANIASIRQYEDWFFDSLYYKQGMVSGHPTAPVYSGMATAIERLSNKCMNDNYTYFSTFVWSTT